VLKELRLQYQTNNLFEEKIAQDTDMRGALDLTEPKHLLGKLEHELQAFSAT